MKSVFARAKAATGVRDRAVLYARANAFAADFGNAPPGRLVESPMQILYGVAGCGLGHTMRARTLAQHLEGPRPSRLVMTGRMRDEVARVCAS